MTTPYLLKPERNTRYGYVRDGRITLKLYIRQGGRLVCRTPYVEPLAGIQRGLFTPNRWYEFEGGLLTYAECKTAGAWHDSRIRRGFKTVEVWSCTTRHATPSKTHCLMSDSDPLPLLPPSFPTVELYLVPAESEARYAKSTSTSMSKPTWKASHDVQNLPTNMEGRVHHGYSTSLPVRTSGEPLAVLSELAVRSELTIRGGSDDESLPQRDSEPPSCGCVKIQRST